VKRFLQILIWTAVAGLGAVALGTIAFHRGEPINATWFVLAAACSYLVAYRLYSAFIAAKLLALDNTRATPAERLDDGRDFVPTNKWVLFGHHFAAIAGPGPLVGPTLAAQFGYLPGTLWLIAGAAFAGCVQDFVILFCSIRRDGKTLGEMARDEVSKRGGLIAQLAVLTIMIILLAVVALVVVNALKSSPWATFTLAMTIPIALLLGVYLRYFRPGTCTRSFIDRRGVGAFRCRRGPVGGRFALPGKGVHAWWRHAGLCNYRLRLRGLCIAGMAAPRAARLSERVHQSRRDFFPGRWNSAGAPSSSDASTHALRGRHRPRSSPEKSFPFVSSPSRCGAISGFHSLISSGTTPKMIQREGHARFIGYGAMLLESFVGVMAMVAACAMTRASTSPSTVPLPS